MKLNLATTNLVLVLVLLVLGTALLSYGYVQSCRQLARMQANAMEANYKRNVIQALANETAEYAKHNPKMEALLKSMNQKPQLGSTNASRMPGK